MPERVHHLHRRIAQGRAGLHDALGDAPGEIALEEVQALAQHMAVVLPADHVGHARRQRLVHQQIVQGVEQRPQDHRHHGHPQQLGAVLAKEVGAGRRLRQIHQAAEEAEQRNVDQGDDQADHDQHGEDRPDLADVIEVEAQDAVGRWVFRSVLEGVDQVFEAAEQHGASLSGGPWRAHHDPEARPDASTAALPAGAGRPWPRHRRLAERMTIGLAGTSSNMPRLVVGAWTIASTTSMPRTTRPNTA